MGRAEVDRGLKFADILRVSIDRHYGGSQGEFARRAGVAGASVSRWLAGLVPSTETIEQIAPYVLDARGNPIPASRLVSIAYPGLAPQRGERVIYVERPALTHALALEADELLAENGPLTEEERKNLSGLVDSLFRPYRRRLRSKRKVS